MKSRKYILLVVFIVAFVIGNLDWTTPPNYGQRLPITYHPTKREISTGHIALKPAADRAYEPRHARSIRARSLEIRGTGSGNVLFDMASNEGPAFWITDTRTGNNFSGGLHANGFPFILASDGAIRNFGLARVDGKQASPIFVLRSDDIVRLVFGLDMTRGTRDPFLVYYTGSGEKRLLFGNYCNAASRACTN